MFSARSEDTPTMTSFCWDTHSKPKNTPKHTHAKTKLTASPCRYAVSLQLWSYRDKTPGKTSTEKVDPVLPDPRNKANMKNVQWNHMVEWKFPRHSLCKRRSSSRYTDQGPVLQCPRHLPVRFFQQARMR